MRGEIKVEALPKSLRTNSRILRKMVDDQTEALQPILKDKDLKETLVKNMKKYLHTSYQIFKNSKFDSFQTSAWLRASEYFMNLMRPGWKNLNKKSAEYKELLIKARMKVV